MLLLALGATAHLRAQTLTLSVAGTLPPALAETSGLETAESADSGEAGSYWTHNDSGGQPKLYRINSSGALERTVHVAGANNTDWEDLARDAAGNLYIGDFGNNANTRADLTIYRVPNPDAAPQDTVTAATITFYYPEQTAFPPAPSQLQFDLEAMVHLNGNLFLFTKNRSEPFTGYTRMYRVPDEPGNYAAQLLDSFYTGPGPALTDWITAADISPDRQKLVLLSYNKLWLFPCRNGRPLLSGEAVKVPFSGGSTQKEGIVFTDNQRVAISDEALSTFLPPRLYTADLGPWIPANCCEPPAALQAQALSSNKLRFTWQPAPGADGYRIRIRGSDGSFAQRTGVDTTQLFSGLSAGLTYQGYAQARCGNQASAPSDTVSIPMLRSNAGLSDVNAPAIETTLHCDAWRFCKLQGETTQGHLILVSAQGAIVWQQRTETHQPFLLNTLASGWYHWQLNPNLISPPTQNHRLFYAGTIWLP
ncbi:MAG: hypothetical protein GC205_10375 [Bacteroidetes bacterium]|nr:hypothetical protein [Bacteroidota bacterium]